MKFHDWTTQYELISKIGAMKEARRSAARSKIDPVDYIYGHLITMQNPGQLLDHEGRRASTGDANRSRNLLIGERKWIKASRPFYNIWPAIVKPLLRLDLERVPARCVSLPLSDLVLRFPVEDRPFVVHLVGGPAAGKDLPVEAIMLSTGVPEADQDGNPYKVLPDHRFLLATLQFNATENSDWEGLAQITNAMRLPNRGDSSVVTELEAGDFTDSDMRHDSVIDMYKLIVSICLLSRDVDDNLVMPEVLSDDRNRYDETHDENLVRRAMKRGVLGWNVGKALNDFEKRKADQTEHAETGRTVSPHFRSPSPFALYWTGPGREQPLFRLRRGTLVHSAAIRKVPTGYAGGLK